MSVILEDDWEESERGNTLLTSEDGNMVAWIYLPDTDRKLQVTFNPRNWPALELKVLSPEKSSDESLAAHINKELTYWGVRTCDVTGANVSKDGGHIAEEPEGES